MAACFTESEQSHAGAREQNCVTGAGKLDVSDMHKMPGKTSDFDFGSFFVQNGAILRQKCIELTGFGYSQKAGLDI